MEVLLSILSTKSWSTSGRTTEPDPLRSIQAIGQESGGCSSRQSPCSQALPVYPDDELFPDLRCALSFARRFAAATSV